MLGSVLFDVDSTVINRESFEELVKLSNPGVLAQIAELSKLAMEGTISFQESFSRRVALAKIDRKSVEIVCNNIEHWLSPGIKDLIGTLQEKGVQVWLISGGLQEVIDRCAEILRIPKSQAHAARLTWDASQIAHVDLNDALSCSKAKGAKLLQQRFAKPAVMVGDGWTDYEVFKEGVAQHFVAYAEWVQRPQVIQAARVEAQHLASDAQELLKILTSLSLRSK